jgi:hypothetical protein
MLSGWICTMLEWAFLGIALLTLKIKFQSFTTAKLARRPYIPGHTPSLIRIKSAVFWVAGTHYGG